MAVNYATSLKTTRMTSVRDAINGGSLEIGTLSGGVFGTVLAALPLNATSGSVSGDTLTITAAGVSATASATGTAARARIKNSGGTVIVDGLTVGTSGADIIIGSTSISSGQTVSLSSGAIQHSA